MEINFAGKTALVTGAGKGIGRETAKLLGKCGAKVIALTRSQSDLDSLAEEIPDLQTICIDLLNLDKAVQAVNAVGHIDLLVNNAAYIIGKTCLEITQDDIEKSMLVCVTAPILLSQVVAKKLQQSGQGGVIVNVSSVATRKATPSNLVYAAAKSALESATKTFAVELAVHKIRVNCILPSLTNTPLVQKYSESDANEVLNAMVQQIPMCRMAEAEEVAHTIVYLLSDKSSYITGQCFVSDGGLTA